MGMNPGILEHRSYSAECSICQKLFREGNDIVFMESIEEFICRLGRHQWFADHVYALCPSCFNGGGRA
jgi:hypothetical protein